jgi:gamma-glutamylcyclotransferase
VSLYFAYASNMDAAVMERLCPGHRYRGVAELPGHHLAFTRRSIRTGSGVADVLPAPDESVWGALYELGEGHLATIDAKEGRGWAYERRAVRVRPAGGGAELDALLYAVIEPGPHVQPSEAYLGGIVRAARARGLPRGYLERLAAHASEVTPGGG